MNVLVVNQQENILSPLNIEIIKTLRGTFSADEIISSFTNFFFARMIIDITALQQSEDIVTYQKLSIGLPIDKVILLIPPTSQVANNFFLSKLISMGYYNFTTNGDGVVYLLDNPNTYKEVAHLHQMAPQSIPFNPTDPMGQGEMANNQPVPQQMTAEQQLAAIPRLSGIRTLGVKNVTEGAGSSSLIYMMKKELEACNFSVICVEVDKREFAFFREQNMISTSKQTLATELLKARDFNYVLVDLNEYEDQICDETLYLVEPSVIKLNRLMLKDRNVFSKIRNKKVVINKSVLSATDVEEFANEAGISVFYVMPPLNDRERPKEVRDLLLRLGMAK